MLVFFYSPSQSAVVLFASAHGTRSSKGMAGRRAGDRGSTTMTKESSSPTSAVIAYTSASRRSGDASSGTKSHHLVLEFREEANMVRSPMLVQGRHGLRAYVLPRVARTRSIGTVGSTAWIVAVVKCKVIGYRRARIIANRGERLPRTPFGATMARTVALTFASAFTTSSHNNQSGESLPPRWAGSRSGVGTIGLQRRGSRDGHAGDNEVLCRAERA